MTSLQGLLYMILFLQATSNMSGCYAFLGIALRSSLRMGLHRHLSHAKMTPIEDETRRRTFHTIRQMDFYVSAILGFPLLLQDEDVDQPLPTEVDDEYITKDAILTPLPGTPSYFQAFNAHIRLMRILARVVKEIYPLKRMGEPINPDRPNATFMISYSRIQEIERELQEWYEQLPTHWRPNPDGPIEVVRYVPFSFPGTRSAGAPAPMSNMDLPTQRPHAPEVWIRACPDDALPAVSPLHFAPADGRQED